MVFLFCARGTRKRLRAERALKLVMDNRSANIAGKGSIRSGLVFSMRQTVMLKENSDFRRVYGKGKSYVNPSIVVYVLRNRRGNRRLGITVGKKIGRAVDRNRAKRIIREAYRTLEMRTLPGNDLVIVARKKTVYLKSTELTRALTGIFSSAGILMK